MQDRPSTLRRLISIKPTGGHVSESRPPANASTDLSHSDELGTADLDVSVPGRQPLSVLVLILRSDGKTLILERQGWPGFWQSVTGGVEWGESLLAAAQRELYEETGLTPISLLDRQVNRRFEIFPQYRHKYPPHVRFNEEREFIAYVDQNSQVRIDPREHVAYRWVDLDEAINVCLSWSNQMALRLYRWQLG